MTTPKHLITILLVITILTLSVPLFPAQALGLPSIVKIVNIIKTIVKYINLAKKVTNFATGTNPNTFAFGGHITHSEGGCALKFRIWTWVIVFGIPIPVPCPGCGIIPLGGNTIEVGPPLKSPAGQIFTFPYITEIYNNHSEGKVGPWALGLGWKPFPIDKINDALSNITISVSPPGLTSCPGSPTTPYIPSCFDDFHLACSQNDKNVILKLGTSP